MGGHGWPWHRDRPAAGVEHVLPSVRRHIVSVPVGPEAVTRAREAVAGRLPEAGVAAGSAFADAVLLVVSELVTNVLRHARSSAADVGITVGAGQLVIGVADADPRLLDLNPAALGAGLRMVAELAAEYDGDISVEPAVDDGGKVVLVRFRLPG